MSFVSRRPALRAALLSIVAAAAAVSSPPARAQDGAVAPSDDAYHFALWADGVHDGSYTEWWYFNVFDARNDLQAIVSYFVTNPDDRLGGGRAQMVAVAYTERGVVTAVDAYPPGDFSASERRADVAIGDNAIQAIDGATYRITGASRDGRLAWDLTYARSAEPWFAADRMSIGSLPWESMSWLVYMPRAEVTGRMIVDGRTREVAAPGYHDHNWGEWVPPHALWNWAQFSDRRLSLEVGDFIGGPEGLVGVDFGGKRTVFAKGEYALVHTRWSLDWKNWVVYPTESILTAENGERRLQVTLRAVRTEPLRGELPFPLRDLIVYEQTARYDGTLWERNGEGGWNVASVLRGPGFKEYTARRY